MAANNYYALILAGGGGTRMWPMSRKETPKQLLALIDERTMFRTAIDRLDPLFTPDHIYVITGPDYLAALQKDAPEIPEENFLIEPYGRNTAPAAALALTVIHSRDPQATVALLGSDHYIAKEQEFRDLLAEAYTIAQDNHIVTLGITPTFPSIGFGYIRHGKILKQINDYTFCYEAIEFTEKPNVVTATGFLASGKYTWNSGMFIWKTEKAMQEFARQQPQVYELMQQLGKTVDTLDYQTTLETIWEQMPKTSIDFAIMEGAENIAIIPVNIGWSDVGSWAALFEVHQLDKFGNCFKGNAPERVILNTHNTMVYSDRLTVTIGIKDIIVVDTDDALMICHRDHVQDVKDVVNHLRATNNENYL